MPVFALANAGVAIATDQVFHPVGLAVGAALIIGKPLGIIVACAIAVRCGLAKLPPGVNWISVLGGGCLAGIGFTMSLFVAGLSLKVKCLKPRN